MGTYVFILYTCINRLLIILIFFIKLYSINVASDTFIIVLSLNITPKKKKIKEKIHVHFHIILSWFDDVFCGRVPFIILLLLFRICQNKKVLIMLHFCTTMLTLPSLKKEIMKGTLDPNAARSLILAACITYTFTLIINDLNKTVA